MTQAIERILVVTAHPDDPEFAAGGTVARLVRKGREVTYAIVTNGNKGAGGRTIPPPLLAEIREEEQRNAARVLGMWSSSANEDGEVEDTRQLRRDVTRQIRRWRPDLIITQHPGRTITNFFGWHRDHRITAGVVLDCVYPLARDHLSFPELLPDYAPHNVRELYLIQWEQPQLVVDITETLGLKLEATVCHASQIGDFQAVEARVRARSSALGTMKGYAYAEGFDHVVLPG
jgi:LmbE family N-acetylglucosaminyl deacetylase